MNAPQMDSRSLIAVRRLIWCDCSEEIKLAHLESSWPAGWICRTHCPPLAVDGLQIWDEEPAFPEHPGGQGKITGAWYVL